MLPIPDAWTAKVTFLKLVGVSRYRSLISFLLFGRKYLAHLNSKCVKTQRGSKHLCFFAFFKISKNASLQCWNLLFALSHGRYARATSRLKWTVTQVLGTLKTSVKDLQWSVSTQPNRKQYSHRAAGMVQWWGRSPPANVARVRF